MTEFTLNPSAEFHQHPLHPLWQGAAMDTFNQNPEMRAIAMDWLKREIRKIKPEMSAAAFEAFWQIEGHRLLGVYALEAMEAVRRTKEAS